MTRCAACGCAVNNTTETYVLERGNGRARDLVACSLPCLADLVDKEST